MFRIAVQRIGLKSLRAAPQARLLSTTLARQNALQELYLKELRNVKLSPLTAQDAEGSVKPWVEPSKPNIPELEAQGVEELQAYKSEPVETLSEAVDGNAQEAVEEDWLVLEDGEEEDSHH